MKKMFSRLCCKLGFHDWEVSRTRTHDSINREVYDFFYRRYKVSLHCLLLPYYLREREQTLLVDQQCSVCGKQQKDATNYFINRVGCYRDQACKIQQEINKLNSLTELMKKGRGQEILFGRRRSEPWQSLYSVN